MTKRGEKELEKEEISPSFTPLDDYRIQLMSVWVV